MWRRAVGLLVLAAVVAVSGAATHGGARAAGGDGYSSAVLADNPVAYWRLGEPSGTTMVDERGANNGTYSGGVLLGRPGALASSSDTSASFDGASGSASVPATTALDATTGVTMELWEKRARSGAYQVLVGKPGNGQSKLENYSLWLDSSNYLVAYFGNKSTYARVASPSPIDTNWHHVAVTYDNASAKLYVDGTLRATTASTVQLTPNNLPLNVGRAQGGGYYYQGLLDEIAVYGTALSAAAVKAHYDASTVDTAAPTVTLTSPAAGARIGNPSPTFSGVAGAASGDASTVLVNVYAGSTATGTPVQTLSAGRQPDSTYSVAVTAPLAEGTYTAQAQQSDSAGNVGLSAAVTFAVDTTAPAPSLLAPADGSSTPSQTPTVTGVAANGAGDLATVTVKVYAGAGLGGTLVRTLTTQRLADDSYSVAVSPALTPGIYTVQSSQSDSAGNTGTSPAATFTVLDTVAPTVTLTSPAAGSFTSNTTPTFSGAAGNAAGDAAVVQIQVYAGGSATGTPVQTLTAARQADNSFSATASAPLAAGTWTAQAEQSDASGNVGQSAAVTFTVDVTAPFPTLTAPANGSTTTDSTPTFAGIAGTAAGDLATVTVKVWAGSTPSGTPVATTTATRAADGTFQIELATPLPTGAYTARAEQSDAAGNLGAGNAVSFTLQAAPSGYRNDVLSDNPGMYLRLGETSGTTAFDSAGTNNGTYVNGPLLGQTGALVGDSNTAVTFDGVNDYVSVPDASAIDAVGAVTVEAWVKRTKSSAYQVIVAKPGNGQSKYENYALWLNTSNQVTAYFGNGTGFVSVGGIALDTAWHLVAATYDNATARLYVDGTQRASTTSTIQLTPNNLPLNVGRSGEGSYYFGGSLDEVAVYPTALPAARIKSHYDSGLGVDSVAPAIAIASPVSGSSVNSSTPAISGTGGRAPGDLDTVTVKVYAGGAATGTPIRTISTSRSVVDGSFSVTVTPALADGTYTAQAEQADSSGNLGRSAAATFRVDTVAPAVTLTAPANGAVTDTVPTFRGAAGGATGDAASVTVDVYAGSAATGTPVESLAATPAGDLSYAVSASPELAPGTYTARARQADAAGNVGRSTAATFTVSNVDATPPVVTLTSPTNGSSTLSGTPTFSGAAGTATGDLPAVTVDVYLGLTATGTPVETVSTTAGGNAWSAVASPELATATYTAIAHQADEQGNVGTSSPTTFTVGLNYRDEVLADSPAGYWRLGEASGTVASDQTGRNPGTYSSGVTLQRPGALVPDADKAASFDGTAGYVTIPDSPSLDFTSGATIELWVKRAKTSAYQVLVGKPGDGQSKNESYALWVNSDDHLVAYFGDGTNYVSVFSSRPLDTSWHHVVATYDNANERLYVDGLLDASAAGNGVHLTPNSLALSIGRDHDSNYVFGGSLDEVAVYPTALSAARVQQHYAKGDAYDGLPPDVTMTTPLAGMTTSDPTPVFAGMAPVTATDSPTVTVDVYAGAAATGTPMTTLTATRHSRGSWDVEMPSALGAGTYTAQAHESDSAGNIGSSPAVTFSVGSSPAAGTDPVVLAAGDIAYCGGTGDDLTANILDLFPSAKVLTVGDNVYESGTADEFANCYDPTWGRAKARTYPTVGDHEYVTPNAQPYFDYFAAQLSPFGPVATDPQRGWYSFDIGAWHVVSLNENCGNLAAQCDPDVQAAWLASDLQAHPAQCTLAVLAAPRFSSGSVHGDNTLMAPYWNAFVAGGVDVVLSGDDHDYERFAPQDTQGFPSATGPRQFVVGTGGRSLYPFSDPNGVVKANSEVRRDDTYGVLKLNLRSTSYDWEFLPVAGSTFTDSGTDSCR